MNSMTEQATTALLSRPVRQEIQHRVSTRAGWSWRRESDVWAREIARAVAADEVPSRDAVAAFRVTSRLVALQDAREFASNLLRSLV